MDVTIAGTGNMGRGIATLTLTRGFLHMALQEALGTGFTSSVEVLS
jgi:3-hydroxyacyl-CoA dehydrogenase